VHPMTSHNPFYVEFAQWIALARDLARVRSLRALWGYLAMPPGWSPDGPSGTTEALRARGLSAQDGALPIHLVRGYRGAAEIRLAVESGEVDGFCGLWDSVKTVWRDGLETGVAVAMIQAGPRPSPSLPGVPMAVDLVRTEEARQLIRAGLILPGTIARGYAAPPGTAPDLVRILRAAFLETLSARDFVAEARRANLEVDPVSGEQLQQAVHELFSLDAAVVERLRELLQ